MSDKKDIPRFIPLNAVSQGSSEKVLCYDAHASLNAIYDCVTNRLEAVVSLLVTVHELKSIPHNMLVAVSVAASLLLNDCWLLLEEFDPIALQLRMDTLVNQ